MVTKNVFFASQGNLWNAADMYGMGNDTLNLMLPAPNCAAIRTYLGNDIVTVLIPAAAHRLQILSRAWQRYAFGSGQKRLLLR